MITELRNGPTIDTNMPIVVAGDPEKISEKKRLKNEIHIESDTINEINEIIYQQDLSDKLSLEPLDTFNDKK